ncbi:hypothetical protein NX059_006042 [Plenodomus lindquistii]|nr:hypothetical protein NX059_006042 [Plenodomus lindquistii]
MDGAATHQTADRDRAQEAGAIRAVRHRETHRQPPKVQRYEYDRPANQLRCDSNHRAPAANTTQIVVEALTRNVKEDHVREIFGKYGVIKDVQMPMNPTFNINRGIAYILYEQVDDAERAIAKMHDAQLDGAKLQVSIVLPRRRFSRTPPPARRGPPPRERFRDDYDGGYAAGRGGRGGAGGPPGAYRPPPMDGPGRYRSPPRRWSPERGGGHWGRGRGRGGRGGGFVRPRSYSRSRSRSPRRSRSRSSFSRSVSRTPPRRQGGGGRGGRGGYGGRRDSPPRRGERGGERGGGGGGGRRSPSYSSYGSASPRDRSRSRSRR